MTRAGQPLTLTLEFDPVIPVPLIRRLELLALAQLQDTSFVPSRCDDSEMKPEDWMRDRHNALSSLLTADDVIWSAKLEKEAISIFVDV